MNVVAYNPENKCYYLVTLHRASNSRIIVKSHKICPDGTRLLCRVIDSDSKADAERMCKKTIRNKIRYDNCQKVKSSDVPDYVRKWFANDVEQQITAEEALALARGALKERYVTLSSNTGIEAGFDLGVQYVGIDEGDADFISVYDRFGVFVGVSRMRVSTIEKTEDCLQAEKVVFS